MTSFREIRKRDSRVAPFDESKIADAIHAALRSAGEGDRDLAVELASDVTRLLEERFAPGRRGGSGPSRIPGIEEVQDQVEAVLADKGHERAAKAYLLHRRRRAALRDTLEVRKAPAEHGAPGDDEGAGWGGGPSLPEVDEALQGASPWQKSRIAAALIREADLDPDIAGEIASQVEEKVLASGIRRISTSLIRELVDNELFERGFEAKLLRQAPIGVPKYDLEQLIFGSDSREGWTCPKTPPEIRQVIANKILHQYSLQEVFTSSVAEAHRENRIFIHRLSDPIRLTRASWTLEPPAAGRRGAERPAGALPGPAYLDIGDLIRSLSRFMAFFSEEVKLSGLPNLLQGSRSQSSDPAEEIASILERLAVLEVRPDIALELELEPGMLPWLVGLRELSRVRPRRFRIAVHFGPSSFQPETSREIEALADLKERQERIEFFPSPAVGPSVSREPALGLSAHGGKITLNLPVAALRSGRERGGSMEREIAAAVDLAIKGHLERRRFLERLGASRENPLWDLLGRSREGPLLEVRDLRFSLGLLGLNECVKYLTGRELHEDGRAADLGREIVRGIRRKLREEERSLGIRLCLEETLNRGPLQSLERADRARYPQLSELEQGRDPGSRPLYSDGVRPHPMAPLDPLRRLEELSPYLRWVEPSGGAVEDLPHVGGGGEVILALEEWLGRSGGGGVGGGRGRGAERRAAGAAGYSEKKREEERREGAERSCT